MQYLLLLLVTSFFSARLEAAAPECPRLKVIAETLEKQLQTKRFVKDCDKMDAKSLGLPANSVGFPNISKKTGEDAEWDYRCKDLSALDMQLRSIENEIALLNGIKSLKAEINQGLETLKKFPNANLAKEASERFLKNLDVARSIEVFLGSNNLKSENILSQIVEDPVGWTDMNSFVGLLRKHCGNFLGLGNTVCTKGFSLTEDTYKELNDFILLGKKTERKFNKNQIKTLSDAMAIKNGKEDYSFNKLASELNGKLQDGVLGPEDMQKINNLSEISDGTKYNFLKEFKSSVKDLKNSQGLVIAQGTPARFSAILNDLKKREEWEMKSKLSLVLNNNASIPEAESESCLKARVLESPISNCLDLIIKNNNVSQLEKSILQNLKSEFRYGEAHISKIDELLKDCVPDAKLIYPSKCDGMVTTQMATLVEKAQYLNALKAKHIQSSSELITFRNFALEKLHSGECMAAGESNISPCSQDLGPISKEAITLTGDAKDILYIFEKPAQETVIDSLCDETDKKVSFQDELCDLSDEEQKKKKEKTNPDHFQPTVDPETRDSSRDALVAFGNNLMQGLAGIMAPRPPLTNPYAPIFPYVQPTAPAMDISTRIMAPYVANGFGSYAPTQGLRPYSSINSNVGTYSAYSFGSSSHFNSPAGQ